MTNNPLIPQSKLPQLGTTIFTQMSALAQQHQAINLSQGFPDFDGPRYLQERLAYHVSQGANQYAPMTGVQVLREAIAQKTERLYGYQPDVDSDITVTAGATEALYAAITALVRNGDEVYEHINFSQQGHASVLAHPQLRERAVAVSSFGKTYHMTGWKVGYCVAPAPISAEIRKVHQYLTFSVNTPAQLALADMLRAEPEHYLALPEFYRQKRDILVNALSESRLEILPCEGTYFLLVDYSAVSTMDDVEFCQWLTREHGVAAIPLSVFCADPFPHKLIRLCFAKKESTLLAAAERLRQL
ncbi:aminotransferase class I/II-fold pyridoxal phosphate-dependent enzyme [Escherichia albertii]